MSHETHVAIAVHEIHSGPDNARKVTKAGEALKLTKADYDDLLARGAIREPDESEAAKLAGEPKQEAPKLTKAEKEAVAKAAADKAAADKAAADKAAAEKEGKDGQSGASGDDNDLV